LRGQWFKVVCWSGRDIASALPASSTPAIIIIAGGEGNSDQSDSFAMLGDVSLLTRGRSHRKRPESCCFRSRRTSKSRWHSPPVPIPHALSELLRQLPKYV
jgi:hypothetical protein